jgi:ferric iron reductase protein FhuF
MLQIQLLPDKVLTIQDTTLRGFDGADLISIITDYLTEKGASALMSSSDERAIEYIKVIRALQTSKDAKETDRLTQRQLDIENNNLIFFKELEKSSKIDFRTLWENVIVKLFAYLKVDPTFNDPNLYTLNDLLLVVELIIKDPKNNLYSFLELIQKQIQREEA